ncbi:MAG: dihydrolipoamide acetyltransferase family protein [Gammaproteobacteria bacterium]
MRTFNLPDLGEGLPEAEIVTWHVSEGQSVKTDEPLVSVETAKAVVDVPSPYTGTILKLHAAEGDIVETHRPLVDFDLPSESDVEPATEAAAEAAAEASVSEQPIEEDFGTVVGAMPVGNEVLIETAIVGGSRRAGIGRVKAAPAVRVLAKRLSIDLEAVSASGKHGRVTAADVKRHSEGGTVVTAPAAPAAVAKAPAPTIQATGKPEPLRGPRRAMAQTMSAARDQVSQCTLFDDADIHGWAPGEDITVRIVRAIAAGVAAEPGLNAWFNGDAMERTVHRHIDLAMAVDTEDGLIVPVLRDIGNKDGAAIRADLNTIKDATRRRAITPADMKNPTITLSNFGMMAGRYATPVIVPPMVSILGTGGLRHDVVPVMGGIEVHKRIPLSLTFDHRCTTGGEACRLLAAVITDLQRAV